MQFLPISGLYGHNMKVRIPKSVCSWWDGPCLFEALDAVELPERDPNGPFRCHFSGLFLTMAQYLLLMYMRTFQLAKCLLVYMKSSFPRRPDQVGSSLFLLFYYITDMHGVCLQDAFDR